MKNGFLLVLLVVSAARAAAAEGPIVLRTEALFYADNTEFFARQEGETTIGAWDRLFLSLPFSDKVELRAGLFANQRYGNDSTFVRPLIALRVGGEHQRLVLGTLETVARREGIGPDRTTLHGLLPPLQNERLSFTRAYESGVQWLLEKDRVRNDLWFNYQKLNTPEHREVLDAGVVGRWRGLGPVALAWQTHIVHEGGQLFRNGPVRDSLAYGLGLRAEGKPASLDQATLEVHGLLSYDNPDREDRSRRQHGRGLLVRASAEKKGWRVHSLLWEAKDFLKEEGDLNYLSVAFDGSYTSRRTYWELGAAKAFDLAKGFVLEGSARLHHVEGKLEYSYRILGAAHFDWPLGR